MRIVIVKILLGLLVSLAAPAGIAHHSTLAEYKRCAGGDCQQSLKLFG